ncbi:MAG: dTDP-4-dehydrorhamnose 3,5-epimerase [Thermomicrobiales bacterium]
MQFTSTALPGVWLVDLEPIADERGFFARAWCQYEFAAHGLDAELVQCNISWNPHQGTLRGLHYQAEPHGEAKLVRCTRGAIRDVAVDLRPDSPARLQHIGVDLTAENRRALFIPAGCAHGFQTLAPDTEVFYQMSHAFVPGASRGVRWDDPALGIVWPEGTRLISERDRAWPDLVR